MLKILIAEDDRELRQLFSHVLTKNGYAVKGVSNGKEALDAMDNDYFDLVITDIMMPVLDGYELVRQLRDTGNITPVLMITAKDAFDDMSQGFVSGTDDYMVKPVNVNEMLLRVKALLRRAQMINDKSTETLQADFISCVSHEFKTPLNAIEGYTTLLQGCENLDETQQLYVEKILFNTTRLSDLAGSILFMSKIENQTIIVSFIMYARLFSSPLTTIAQGMTNLQTAAAASNRIFEFLEAEELEDESHKTAHIVDPKGNVTFDHVRFAYPTTPDKIIIKDFSATAKAGQKIAIVGPTGAGKSTLVNLLMRFFEVNSGSISIDGIPIQDMKREHVHALFSMVLQDTWLFDGTIRENLVYNMKNLTDADLDRVCKSCSLEHFIRSLPNGYDTVLAENTEVSSGQKQLLTIARAMLQDSPMLILDEATSSVDTRTEAMIQKAMDELMKNRTSFVIAHRLSTIKNADLILVMKDGDVIEKGNHEELMAAGGFYANLYNSQFDSKTA